MSHTAGAAQTVPLPAASRARARQGRTRGLFDGFEPERFPGELVLHDLERIGPAESAGARTILLRFLVAQYFVNELRGDWPAHLLRQQRNAALNALGPTLPLDGEERALRMALERAEGGWRAAVVRLLARAAAAARTRAHPAGALALHHICYEAALAHGWKTEAAAAAREIAAGASLAGDERTRGRWRRRATVLASAVGDEAAT